MSPLSPRTAFLALVAGLVGGLIAQVFVLLVILSNPAALQNRIVERVTREVAADAPPDQLPQVITNMVDEDAATTEVVERVLPSVVSVIVSKEVSPGRTIIIPFGSPDGISVAPSPGKSQRQDVGGGTGFIVTSDGYIITNRHVISDTNAQYAVVLRDGTRYDATVVAKDTFVDIGVLKINAKNLPVVKLGDSATVKIGQTVIAVGNSLAEFKNTVTKGIVSGLNRRVVAGGGLEGSEVIDEAIQTDAAINPGNSGGPLINLKGEVIGMNTAVSLEGQLIGFAIPSNTIKPVIKSVRDTGRIVRAWIGVRYIAVDSDIQQKNNLSVDYGALIAGQNSDAAVVEGGPAAKAGIRAGDIILSADGKKITGSATLANVVMSRKPGDKVVFEVLRGDNRIKITVTLEELDPEKIAS